jgi:hypothetical protein
VLAQWASHEEHIGVETIARPRLKFLAELDATLIGKVLHTAGLPKHAAEGLRDGAHEPH